MKRARYIWFTLFVTISVNVVWGHEPGLSTSRVEVTDQVLRFEVAFAPSDIRTVLAEADRNEVFARVQADLERHVASFFRLYREGQRLSEPAALSSVFNVGDNIAFRFEIPRGTGAQWAIHVEGLPSLPKRHRHYLSMVTDDGVLLAEKLFDSADVVLQLQLPPSTQVSKTADGSPRAFSVTAAPATPQEEFSRTRMFSAFFKLGVEHLITGFDHLLFLFGLLLVCDRWKRMLLIVTSFTVGHSITLALATLNLIHLEGKWVEAAIAASIIYVGVENLMLRVTQPPARWVLTLVFGLVHGMGFAGVLRELGVGESAGGVVVPLVAFNLGVEAGQMVLAALGLPLLWQARKHEIFVRRGVPGLSLLIAAAGLYWLVERILL